MLTYKNNIYVKTGAQVTPHKPMTPSQKLQFKNQMKRYNNRGMKKQLKSFTQPVWRAIRGKKHQGCWQSTFTYILQSGRASQGKSTNWTKCVSYDKTDRPTITKSTNKSGYKIVTKKSKAAEEKKNNPKPVKTTTTKTRTKTKIKL